MVNEIKKKIKRLDNYRWLIPQDFKAGMRVPGLIFADEELLDKAIEDKAFEQVINVAFLPGIVKYSLAMPDIHWGYGLPIGGVAPVRVSDGVISPGGVGSDINCGVRLLRSELTEKELRPHLEHLIDKIYINVPCGVGSTGKIRISGKELDNVLIKGARWAIEHGYGWNEDIPRIEENGCMANANPDALSKRAKERGYEQIGTLGAGNHFLEIQVVEEIFDEKIAEKLGIFKGQITVMIHTGSRGLGYQVCEDYMASMVRVAQKYGISLPDRQLACAPINSPEGKEYLGAMAAAANYAWANREAITHWVRESFEQVFGSKADKLGLKLVYDVAHNIAKFEKHTVDNKELDLLIHRKGATRAFGPGHEVLPPEYKEIGQPVIIPGDMGRASYLLVGTEGAMKESFGSTCHGAGRCMSRAEAIRKTRGRRIDEELWEKGIYVKARGRDTLGEEVSEAYKDVTHIVNVVAGAGISAKIAKMRPLGVVKG